MASVTNTVAVSEGAAQADEVVVDEAKKSAPARRVWRHEEKFLSQTKFD